AFCSATCPIATSIIPPFAAFFIKVLSLSLNDEPSPATFVSAALIAPVRLIASITKPRINNCETILILVFMILFDLTRRGEPSLKYKSKAAGSLDAKQLGVLPLLPYQPEIFRSYELS